MLRIILISIDSPKIEIKNATAPLRANLKQQLMRQQMHDEENKKITMSTRQHLSLPQTINSPLSQSLSTDVPTKILRVSPVYIGENKES